MPADQQPEGPDYDHLLRSIPERVFNQRDPLRRAEAIAELFAAEPVMYEPDGIVTGRAAISTVADKLLDRFGADFAFVPTGPAAGHHGTAMLHWHKGPRHGHRNGRRGSRGRPDRAPLVMLNPQP